jgi:prepilin-type N-terminal cleavage/methylation domain-containing protein
MTDRACKDRHRGPEAGFTLIELLVAAALMLVVFALALGMLQLSGQKEPEARAANARIQEAQVGVERIIRELRQTYDVVSATPSSLTVETYLQTTSCINGTTGSSRACRVTYACASGNCTRTVGSVGGSSWDTPSRFATDVLSNNVFTYSPNSTDPTSVTMTVGLRAEGSEDAITLSDGAVMRNVSVATP